MNQIKVRGSYKLPLDPLAIKSMDDYDLSLSLHRPWFTYDKARRVKPGIISKWEFDNSTGSYIFGVNPSAKWSNGHAITADDLIKNLKRAKKLKSKFGDMIFQLIEERSLTAKDNKTIHFETKSGKPSESLFQRLGAQSFGIVHPSDFNDKGQIVSNNISSGPYIIKSSSDEIIELHPNQHDYQSIRTIPNSVLLKKSGVKIDIEDFIMNKTWVNLLTTYTLMEQKYLDMIKSKNIPYWTRGVDRVSLIRPLTQSKNIKENRKILKSVSKLWIERELPDLPLTARKAYSLQPEGYPLLNELNIEDYESIEDPKPEKRKVSICTISIEPTVAFKHEIESLFTKTGYTVEWVILSKGEFLSQVTNQKTEFDFSMFSFGVADPDPGTWISLIVRENSIFLDVEASDIDEAHKSLALSDRKLEIESFKKLLKKMQLRGSYLPLYHFSTLVLGRPGMNFKNIDELDETVEFSKMVFQ